MSFHVNRRRDKLESGKPSRGTRSAAERANGQSTWASTAGNANANGKLTAKCDGPLGRQERERERDREDGETAAGKQPIAQVQWALYKLF